MLSSREKTFVIRFNRHLLNMFDKYIQDLKKIKPKRLEHLSDKEFIRTVIRGLGSCRGHAEEDKDEVEFYCDGRCPYRLDVYKYDLISDKEDLSDDDSSGCVVCKMINRWTGSDFGNISFENIWSPINDSMSSKCEKVSNEISIRRRFYYEMIVFLNKNMTKIKRISDKDTKFKSIYYLYNLDSVICSYFDYIYHKKGVIYDYIVELEKVGVDDYER